MMVLVTYDVNTTTAAGRKRLRAVARACQDWGQRVQFSVFEIELDPAEWVALRTRLEGIIDPARDSLRYYHLGSNWSRRVEHVGVRASLDFTGPIVL